MKVTTCEKNEKETKKKETKTSQDTTNLCKLPGQVPSEQIRL